MSLLRIFIGVVVVVFLLGPAPNQADQQDDASKIVERSVEVLKKDWDAESQFNCSERDRDKNGIRTYEDIMLDGSRYQKLVAVNDQHLDTHQQAEQQQKFQRAAAERRSESNSQKRRRIARYQADRKRERELITELSRAFTFTMVGTDKLDGHDVYLLSAEPRKGYRPPNSETRVLTGMHGKLWVEQSSFQWVKVEVEVVHPVSIGGFIARVEPGTRFELEQVPVSGDIWLPSHFAVKSRSKVVFLFNHQTDEDDTYFNYHPAQTQESSANPSPITASPH
jgi:hypothetical protein